MTVFILKLIAMGTMLTDHVAYWFLNNNMLLRNVGRLAFLTYAFLIAESFFHLREKPEKLRKHLLKLFLLTLITEIPYDLFLHKTWLDTSTQNALFALSLGFAALILAETWREKVREQKAASLGALAIFLLAAEMSVLLKSEFAPGGVLLIGIFYLYLLRADEWPRLKRLLALLTAILLYFGIQVLSGAGYHLGPILLVTLKERAAFLPGMLLAALPLALYDREKGWDSKWFRLLYSSFYPLQFLILVLIRRATLGF